MITAKPLQTFKLSTEILPVEEVPPARLPITFHPLDVRRASEDTLRIKREAYELDATKIFLLNALLIHRPRGGINQSQLTQLAYEDGIGETGGVEDLGKSLDVFARDLYESTGQLVVKHTSARVRTWQLTPSFMLLEPGKIRPLDGRLRDPDELLDNARDLAAAAGIILPELEHLDAVRRIKDFSRFSKEDREALHKSLTRVNKKLEKRSLKISD